MRLGLGADVLSRTFKGLGSIISTNNKYKLIQHALTLVAPDMTNLMC